MAESFSWRDGERIVRFGRDALDDAPQLLGDRYTLLTTARAATMATTVVKRATAVHHVPSGRVDEIAGDLLNEVDGTLLVALGGGRVIDVTKALAAAHNVRASAIPTTLSAAEMTALHRHARGVDVATAHVRPSIVINDPALSASQPKGERAASAANALGHAIEGAAVPGHGPVPRLIAAEAARLLTDQSHPDNVALGALLSGCVVDATGLGLHHVLAQTLARFAGVGHAQANAALLPHTTVALRERSANALAQLDAATDVPMEALARRLAQRAQAQQLRDFGVTRDALELCVGKALERAQLATVPPAPDEAEVRALYEAAW